MPDNDYAETIAVIGAGIGGLTAAIALCRAGFSVKVYEQATQLTEVGAGITVSPNADKILRHLNLRDAIGKVSFVPQHQLTQNFANGAIVLQTDVGGYAGDDGPTYYHLHRADLHDILAAEFERLCPGGLHLDHQLESCAVDGTAKFSNGEQIEAGLIIGCDGVKSRVRDSVFSTGQPYFTGQVAWRGLARSDRLHSDSKMRNPGIHIGPGVMMARYPIRAGQLINFVAFVVLDEWCQESWSARSSVAELKQHITPCDPELLALLDTASDEQMFKWALHVREPLPEWSAGRVTLLGDAAHAMLPFLGQGAAMAMEDAIVLQRCLSASGLREALKCYARTRQSRTTMVQLQSRLRGEAFQGVDPSAFSDNPIKSAEELGLFDYDAAHAPIGDTA